MTRKQIESIIRFSSVFNDPANDISVVNEQFGLSLTEATSPSQAVTAYLEAKGIRLEGERTPGINEGDWCFFRMELCLVKRIDKNWVELSNGYTVSSCGHYAKDECFPLDLSIKVISKTFKNYSNRLHEVKHVNLNYPDIMRYIEQEYKTQCENYLAGRAVTYEGIAQFYDEIIEQTRVFRKEFVNGIKIIRPWKD